MNLLIQTLCDAPGVGGCTDIAECIKTLVRPFADEVSTDAFGNVVAIRRCGRDNAPLVLLEAHMDEIGFVVTNVDESGFVHVAACGGIDRRVLAATEVTLLTDPPINGVFCSTPPHLSNGDDKLKPMDEMGIDVGLSPDEAVARIPKGTRGVFRMPFAALGDHCVTCKALDNRVGCAAVIKALELLKGETLSVDVAALFAVQEEVGGAGATVAAFAIEPHAAIVTDVSFASTPDAPSHKCGELGKGAMLGMAPGLNTSLTNTLKRLAEENELPLQFEVMGGSTGTDADHIVCTKSGIPTALLSIPLRYMHTPVETVDVRDVTVAAKLMAYAVKEGIAL